MFYIAGGVILFWLIFGSWLRPRNWGWWRKRLVVKRNDALKTYYRSRRIIPGRVRLWLFYSEQRVEDKRGESSLYPPHWTLQDKLEYKRKVGTSPALKPVARDDLDPSIHTVFLRFKKSLLPSVSDVDGRNQAA